MRTCDPDRPVALRVARFRFRGLRRRGNRFAGSQGLIHSAAGSGCSQCSQMRRSASVSIFRRYPLDFSHSRNAFERLIMLSIVAAALPHCRRYSTTTGSSLVP